MVAGRVVGGHEWSELASDLARDDPDERGCAVARYGLFWVMCSG